MTSSQLKFFFASFACTATVVLLAFMSKPGVIFSSVWGEMAVVSILFTGAVIFLAAGLKEKKDSK